MVFKVLLLLSFLLSEVISYSSQNPKSLKCDPPRFPPVPRIGTNRPLPPPKHSSFAAGAEKMFHSTRRAFSIQTAATFMLGGGGVVPSSAVATSPPDTSNRIFMDVGGGTDILSATPKIHDVLYPASLIGLWECQRVVTSIEGNKGQAELALRALGGTGSSSVPETYLTKFITPPEGVPSTYSFEGEQLTGVILDRGFEMSQRTNSDESNVKWSALKPDTLSYVRKKTNINAATSTFNALELTVIQRSVELPNEKGFGFNELIRIEGGGGGNDNPLFPDQIQRAVQVKRRYRRGFDDNGNRIVEGLEIVKTFRVLDGVAGTEMPTSTTKSRIRFTRPSSATSS